MIGLDTKRYLDEYIIKINSIMFKTSFATALTMAAVEATDPHNTMKVSGLVEGFFIGAFDFHGMTDIAHCLGDVNPLEEHLENAMRGFWNGSY